MWNGKFIGRKNRRVCKGFGDMDGYRVSIEIVRLEIELERSSEFRREKVRIVRK